MVTKEVRTYNCNWPKCGVEFKQAVGFTGGGVDGMGSKQDMVTDAVRCPSCGNGLKTWDGVI